MIVEKFINNSLPILKDNDSIHTALKLMKNHRLEHFCVVLNGQVGIIALNDIKILPKNTLLIKAQSFHRPLSVQKDKHIWEALRSFHQYDTCILPVINSNQGIAGTLSIWDISQRLYDIFPIYNGGAILQMEMHYQDYSLSELSQIIEGVNAKITMLNVFPIKNSNRVEVVFCIDKNDATECIQALERHDYAVDAWFMNKGKIDSLMEERYSAFMKYINI